MLVSKESKVRLRHEHELAVERLRLQINMQLDRTAKLHQHEFEVLPEAWRLLQVALGHSGMVLSRHIESVDLNRMTDAQLSAFLEVADLKEWQKDEIRASADRTGRYLEAKTAWNMQKAIESHGEFHNYLLDKGIFIQEPTKGLLKNFGDRMRAAVNDRVFMHRNKLPGPQWFEKGDAFLEEWPSLVRAIEEDVSGRLWTPPQD